MDVILWLQRFANPALDTFFLAVTRLGSEEVYAAIVAFVYWCVNRRLGFRLGLLVFVTFFLNAAVKDALGLPRPGGPGVRVLAGETGLGPGFPSGHAQGTTTVWAYLYAAFRRRGLLAAALVIVPLVSLSRLYLGLHYPADVLGGIAIGLAVVAAFQALAARLGRASPPPWLPAAGGLALPLLALLLYRSDDAYRTVGALIGMAEGYLLQERLLAFSERTTPGRQAIKLVIGLAGLLAVRVVTKPFLPDGPSLLLRYGLTGLWTALGAPLTFRALGLAGPRGLPLPGGRGGA